MADGSQKYLVKSDKLGGYLARRAGSFARIGRREEALVMTMQEWDKELGEDYRPGGKYRHLLQFKPVVDTLFNAVSGIFRPDLVELDRLGKAEAARDAATETLRECRIQRDAAYEIIAKLNVQLSADAPIAAAAREWANVKGQIAQDDAYEKLFLLAHTCACQFDPCPCWCHDAREKR